MENLGPSLDNLESRIFYSSDPNEFSSFNTEITTLKSKIPRKNPLRERIGQIQMLATIIENISRLEASSQSLTFGRTHRITMNRLKESVFEYRYYFPSSYWEALIQRIENVSHLFEFTAFSKAQAAGDIEEYIPNWIDRIEPLGETLEQSRTLSPLSAQLFSKYEEAKNCFIVDLESLVWENLDKLSSSGPLVKGVTTYFLEDLYNRYRETHIGACIFEAATMYNYTFMEDDFEPGRFTLRKSYNYYITIPSPPIDSPSSPHTPGMENIE